MVPPVTPSPHRFLTKSTSNPSRRNFTTSQAQQPREPNFASTPRFAFRSPLPYSSSSVTKPNDVSPGNIQDAGPSSLAFSTAIPAHTATNAVTEDIDIFATPSSPLTPPLPTCTQLHRHHELLEDTIEPASSPGALSQERNIPLQPASSPPPALVPRSPGLETPRAKRRRGSGSSLPDINTPPWDFHDQDYHGDMEHASQITSSPPMFPPVRLHERGPIQSSSRFVLPSPRTDSVVPMPLSTAVPVENVKPHRPAFLRPRLPNQGGSTSGHGEDLASFNPPMSPQRKSHRYITGGLAATVRDWVLEASGSTGIAGRENVHFESVGGTSEPEVTGTSDTFTPAHCLQQSKPSAPLASNVRVQVSEIVRTGMSNTSGNTLFLRGQRINKFEDSEAHEDGESLYLLLPSVPPLSKVSPGQVLDVKPPFWNVDAAGRTWLVAINWVQGPHSL